MRLPARLCALILPATLALTGCSDGGETPDADGTSSPTETPTTEPYLPVPDGIELTEQGSSLAVGDTAVVAYEPRQDFVGALEITVTSLEKADFAQFVGWDITPEIKATAPYFVRAKVSNVGETDLGSGKGLQPVPLYAVDGENRLIESSLFKGSFKPCESASFPKKFETGDTLRACMVYLAPGKGDLAAVSFRPSQEFNPIIWEGEVVPAKGSAAGKQDGGKKGDDKKRGTDGGGRDNA